MIPSADENWLRKQGFTTNDKGKTWSKGDCSNARLPSPEPKQNKKTSLVSAPPTQSGVQGDPEKIYAKIRIKHYRSRLLDEDNPDVKDLVDCLVEAGFFPDDSSVYVKRVTNEQIQVKKGQECTKVIITYL